MKKLNETLGCRTQLNPNGSDLRCGDKAVGLRPDGESSVHLCNHCALQKVNNTLVEALNRRSK